jgi:anti-anti-sigma factor
MADLIINTISIPDGLRLSLQGDAGMADLEPLDRELMRAAAAGPAIVVVDLSQLKFISSAGMGAFLKMRSILAKKNGIVRLSGASPEIAEAFQRARLDKLFDFVDAV